MNELPELRWKFISQEAKKDPEGPDLRVVVKDDAKKNVLLIEVKSSGEPRIIAELSGRAKIWTQKMAGYPVLAAPYISARGREMCKSLNIGFVDFSGNAYLKFDGVLIERWGKETMTKEKRYLKSLFTKKSTWIIRRMLMSPEKAWKFDQLARDAGVSLGQVYKVIEKLESDGYADKKRGAITLIKPGDLLNAWAETYRFDKQESTGYYCSLKETNLILDKLKSLPDDAYALTLGAGVSLVAPFVRSTDVYIYTTDIQSVVDALNLKPVEFGGNVVLVTPSDATVTSGKQNVEGLSVVSNIQLYLDLYNFPMRGREQAEHLRNQVMEI